MKITELQSTEFASYYEKYINLVGEQTLLEALESGIISILAISEKVEKANKEKFSYADGKWSVQDLILHLIDTERIFCYRALCISRKDKTSFPGFEENDYVASAKANERSFESIISEFVAVRNATISLFESFNDEQMQEIGTASNFPVSARAIGFIISGHQIHHENILNERYL